MNPLRMKVWNLDFESCFLNASGPRCRTEEQLDALGESKSAAIVLKSATLLPREGNEQPRYFENEWGSINSVGLANLGYKKYCELVPKLKRFEKPVIASIAGFNQQEFEIMAEAFDQAGADALEINLSCPNIAGKTQACYDLAYSEKVLESVRSLTEKPLTVKLAPFLDIEPRYEMALLLKKTKMDGVVLINSVGNALLVDPHAESVVIRPKKGMGGLGGRYIKPIALANLFSFHEKLKGHIPLMGVGGIENGWDAFEHVLCGASLVQVGSALQKEGPIVFERLERELEAILRQKKYGSLDDFRGKLKFEHEAWKHGYHSSEP